ncbi:hypothetical protein D922_02699 [Enterococcus faecalis 06-MB-DW-09]|nr:hypothetical protein D922_02699 [Enterococcus faecalis 06-MB-DW-09]
MKFLRLATITALSMSIIGGGSSVLAAEIQNHDTEVGVRFSAVDEDGNGQETEVINPEEEGPDVEIDPIGPDGENTGPLTISYAPTMDFGQQVITNQNMSYSMIAEEQPLKVDGEMVPYVSFAQVQDTRGTNAGWDLRVTLSDFTADTQNDTLHGATIEFVSSHLRYVGNEGNEPVVHTDGLTLDAGGSANSVLSAEQGKGAGTSSVVWGDQEALDQQEGTVLNENILLHIPGSTAKDEANYEATLTWQLLQTPGATGE